LPFGFDLLFEVQVPRPWTEGKERDKFHQAVEQAVLAEQMGFDTVWFVEHHFLASWAHSSAPEVVLGALSQRTSKIRLGHGVTLLPGAVNHPIRVAERAAMLDIMSDGRLEMGTGRSSSPYQLEAFGTEVATTREQWEEAIKLLPKLWSTDDFSYHGRFFSWDDKVTVVPRPVQKPHPPLWVAATQPETCRIAGEKGIGLLMPALSAPEQLRTSVDSYKAAVADPIDQVGEFRNDQAALFSLTFCHDDDDAARVIGGSAALWYVETIKEIYSNDWKGVPLEQIPESYRAQAEARRRGAAGPGTVGTELAEEVSKGGTTRTAIDGLIETGAFCVGDPKRVLDNVRKYVEVGGDRIVSIMQMADIPHDDIMRSIELFGSKVIPEIRKDEKSAESTS
jgi:alkanesulfonate monooxygenase SsuD/methylene tetrahydromethanopterin reductase-like flavin-dependent oxidoreductase (luciferase family)